MTMTNHTKILIPKCTYIISNQILIPFVSASFISNMFNSMILPILFVNQIRFLHVGRNRPVNYVDISIRKRHHLIAFAKGELKIISIFLYIICFSLQLVMANKELR